MDSTPLQHLCRALLALGLVSAPGMPAHAQQGPAPGDTAGGAGGAPGYPYYLNAYDPREVALLPRYCAYTQFFRDRVGHNPEEVERWYSIMGPSFHHMHHYCWGLMKTNRALYLVRTQQFRTFYLGNAVQEFEYVIRNVTPDFVMLPEIFTKKGENLIRLGKAPLGIVDLQHAIELKPDYWPPYASISDYYKDQGDPAQAREWLEKGLAAVPDAKALTQRLSELDSAQRARKSPPQRTKNPPSRKPAGENAAQPAGPQSAAER
jgi:tetratricopeptide (TPR) repeat protein